MSKGWVGVDLDGTLAIYEGWTDATHIGEPVPAMAERVKRWLAAGREVRIVTARVEIADVLYPEASTVVSAIRAWCLQHLGAELPVTCVKDYHMLELWDDRAVQVIPNTGEPVGTSTRGLD